MLVSSFIILFLLSPSISILRCAQEQKPKTSKFHFVAACTRSSMKTIAARQFDDWQTCKQLAIRYRGFAINFVHRDLLHKAVQNYTGPTCLVYDCPEFEILDPIDRNTVFDYYSSYARPMRGSTFATNRWQDSKEWPGQLQMKMLGCRESNALIADTRKHACIPKVGVFQLHREMKNFTEAMEICEDEGGYLADITSAMHTIQISSLISSMKVKEAYVGLDEIQNKGEFLNAQGLPLNCVQYRAWAPGEPKPIKGEKCVLLTSGGQWRAAECKKRFPFVCELHPSGPLRPCRKFRRPRRRQNCIERFKETFPTEDRRPRCGDPSVVYEEPQVPNPPQENIDVKNTTQGNRNSTQGNTNFRKTQKNA